MGALTWVLALARRRPGRVLGAAARIRRGAALSVDDRPCRDQHARVRRAHRIGCRVVDEVLSAGIAEPYEQLKALTRGKAITRDVLQAFIRGLDIPATERDRLLALTPRAYVGLAATLARSAADAAAAPSTDSGAR